jgi:putative transposase
LDGWNDGKKRHKPEEIVAKLRPVDVLTGQGKSIAEAVKTIAVTETTYFRWRAECGGSTTTMCARTRPMAASPPKRCG